MVAVCLEMAQYFSISLKIIALFTKMYSVLFFIFRIDLLKSFFFPLHFLKNTPIIFILLFQQKLTSRCSREFHVPNPEIPAEYPTGAPFLQL